MKKSRFTDEQIVASLRQAEAGVAVKELCRANGFSDATFYKWRARFGGMQGGEATRLRESEAENRQAQEAAGRGAPAHRSIEGGLRGKTLAPQVRREAARRVIELLDISERRACSYAGLSRTSYREPPATDATTSELSARIVELAHARRRFGYRRIHDLLIREGHKVNHIL